MYHCVFIMDVLLLLWGFFFFNRKKKQCGCGIFIMDCKVYSKGLTIFHSPIIGEHAFIMEFNGFYGFQSGLRN